MNCFTALSFLSALLATGCRRRQKGTHAQVSESGERRLDVQVVSLLESFRTKCCCPGCFSIYNARAMKLMTSPFWPCKFARLPMHITHTHTYTHIHTRAFLSPVFSINTHTHTTHQTYIMKEMGEDRWLHCWLHKANLRACVLEGFLFSPSTLHCASIIQGIRRVLQLAQVSSTWRIYELILISFFTGCI